MCLTSPAVIERREEKINSIHRKQIVSEWGIVGFKASEPAAEPAACCGSIFLWNWAWKKGEKWLHRMQASSIINVGTEGEQWRTCRLERTAGGKKTREKKSHWFLFYRLRWTKPHHVVEKKWFLHINMTRKVKCDSRRRNKTIRVLRLLENNQWWSVAMKRSLTFWWQEAKQPTAPQSGWDESRNKVGRSFTLCKTDEGRFMVHVCFAP